MAASRISWLAGAIACLSAPVAAQQLDPQVGVPLMQLIHAAGMQCQAGNQQACALVPQLQQAGQELMQAQFACQQGNPQACQVFQMGAQQVIAAWQQNFGGAQAAMMPQQQPRSPQQQTWEHQQRMQQQRQMFDQHQERMRQQQQMFDEQNRRFREQLLR
jgi:hypothetical protein